MPALYVDIQGARVARRDGEIVVSFADREQRYPQAQVERLVLLGNVQVTTQVLAACMDRGVPVMFLTMHGRLRGRVAGSAHANVRLRMRQYEVVRDEPRALAVARWFVLGKVRNAKEFLAEKLARCGKETRPFRERMKGFMNAAMHTTSMERLRGIEGMAAREVYGVFGDLLTATPFRWRGRNRRPPRDPVNAMLSLGYTLLRFECEAAAESVGLDIYAGLLHGGQKHAEYGKPALALDLMEEFRWLVERLVLRLAKEMRGTDFERTPDGGCSLKVVGRRRFFAAWERLMDTRVRYDARRRLSWRAVIGEQAARLARAFAEDETYRPFMP